MSYTTHETYKNSFIRKINWYTLKQHGRESRAFYCLYVFVIWIVIVWCYCDLIKKGLSYQHFLFIYYNSGITQVVLIFAIYTWTRTYLAQIILFYFMNWNRYTRAQLGFFFVFCIGRYIWWYKIWMNFLYIHTILTSIWSFSSTLFLFNQYFSSRFNIFLLLHFISSPLASHLRQIFVCFSNICSGATFLCW